MRDYLKKLRQQSYLQNEWDDIDLSYIVNYENLIDQIIRFFRIESQLIYPAKSYFVAIVYAACLKRWFDIDFNASLDDPELLPDDRYYLPYSMSKDVYQHVLTAIGDIWQYPSINKTVEYFKKEFMVN